MATSRSRSWSTVSSGSISVASHRVDGPGVEAGLHRHQADPRLGVALEQGPLHRGRTAPPGQEGEVEVHHRQPVQDGDRDDPTVGDDDAEFGAHRRGHGQVVGHRQAELEGRGLDRAGHRRPTATPSLVGTRHHQCHVVAGGHQRAQRRDGGVGGTEIDQAGHGVTLAARMGRPGAPRRRRRRSAAALRRRGRCPRPPAWPPWPRCRGPWPGRAGSAAPACASRRRGARP